ncbi:uncharacterized protein [Ptychodera flava]|uniref:uncharacterized protein n=1 Tax=Ptychodera flava TaxID=63121 RepID=UPI003969DEDB
MGQSEHKHCVERRWFLVKPPLIHMLCRSISVTGKNFLNSGTLAYVPLYYESNEPGPSPAAQLALGWDNGSGNSVLQLSLAELQIVVFAGMSISPFKATWVGETEVCTNPSSNELLIGGIDDLRRLEGFIPNSPRGAHLHRSLLQFDVSTVADPSRVKLAYLEADVEKHARHGFQSQPSKVTMWPIKVEWSATGMTWELAGKLLEGVQEGWPVKIPEEDGVVWKVNLTEVVRGWIEAPADNHGLCLMNGDGRNDSEAKQFNLVILKNPRLTMEIAE